MDTATSSAYRQLQPQMEALLGQIGLEKTIFLLDSFLTANDAFEQEQQPLRLVPPYLVMACIGEFDLEGKRFFTSNILEYREARMACYHLLHKHTRTSYAKIAEGFGLTKRNVLYGCQKCEERLELPYHYKVFKRHYAALEKGVIYFISTLTRTYDEDSPRSAGRP